MAIVQISRITQRKGLQINLPQLAGAEFGWSIDERRLFIGNGTLQEGAPVIGNTEILTEFSDILAFQTNYTYKGEAGGYVVQTGPTPSTPVSQSLQSWLDQFATVKDFGAVGDGVTDDTAAINRALQQLFCRNTNPQNPQVRRSLFFPAGVYIVNSTILIPPYATLYGEGADNSIIQMQPGDDSTARAYVARTTDSLQQTGASIISNGAIRPQNVTISNMAFQTLDEEVDVFLIEDAQNVTLQNVNFIGPLTTANLTAAPGDIAGIRFSSTPSLISSSVTVDRCSFQGLTFGIATENQTQGITVSNSRFDTLYQGVALGTTAPINGGPTGFKILHNFFDNIFAEGVIFGNINLNATGYNIFYDVGNSFLGVANPSSSIIRIAGANNVSIGDMFERADAFSTSFPRVLLVNNVASIATTNGKKIEMGTFARDSGLETTLTNFSSGTVLTSTENAFVINYTIVRSTAYRTGTLTITNNTGIGLSWSDDYVQNIDPGVTIGVSESSGTVSVNYTTDNSVDGVMYHSIYRLI